MIQTQILPTRIAKIVLETGRRITYEILGVKGLKIHISLHTQGVKLIFFSDSHLAPKFIKVVANSKKVGRHFERQTKPFFYAVIVLEIKLGKRSLTCYKGDTRKVFVVQTRIS